MVESLLPLAEAVLPELGPVGWVAAGLLTAAAVTGLVKIGQTYTGSSLSSTTTRTADAYAAILNDLQTQYHDVLTALPPGGIIPGKGDRLIYAQRLLEQIQQVTDEATAYLANQAYIFDNTTFASTEEANVDYQALTTDQARQFSNSAQQSRIQAHYQAEITRLTTPAVVAPVVSPTVVNVTMAQILAGYPLSNQVTYNIVSAAPSDVVNPGAVDTNLGLESYLTGALPLVGTSLVAALAASAQDIGCGLQRGTYQCQDTGFASLMSRILPSIAPLGIIAFLNNPSIAQQFTDPLTKAFLDTFITMPEIQKPITPDDAPSVIRAVFSRAMGLGIGAHLASEVAESSTTMKYMGLNYIAAFLCDMAGFGKIAQATMGVVESQALGLPMRYYVNEHVRTELPRMADLLRLAEHRELTEAEFMQLAAYQGYSNELGHKYYHIAHRPAGYFMLRRMAASGIWDEAYYKLALEDTGFDDLTVAHALDMLYSEAHADLKVIGVSPAMTRFKEGLDDVETLKTNLATLGVTETMIPKYVFAAQLSEDYDSYVDYKTALIDSVRKGLSTPADLKAALVQRGLAADRAQQLADLESIRLYATPKKLPLPT